MLLFQSLILTCHCLLSSLYLILPSELKGCDNNVSLHVSYMLDWILVYKYSNSIKRQENIKILWQSNLNISKLFFLMKNKKINVNVFFLFQSNMPVSRTNLLWRRKKYSLFLFWSVCSLWVQGKETSWAFWNSSSYANTVSVSLKPHSCNTFKASKRKFKILIVVQIYGNSHYFTTM